MRRVSGRYSTRRHSARSAVLLEYRLVMLAYMQMVWGGECVCDTRLAADLYQLQRGILTILPGSFSLFSLAPQVQMVVTARVVGAKCRTRFNPKSCRTPGTTIAFSKSSCVIFNSYEHASPDQ